VSLITVYARDANILPGFWQLRHPPLLRHSFRVTMITDLLEQCGLLEDVHRLAGHADSRNARLSPVARSPETLSSEFRPKTCR